MLSCKRLFKGLSSPPERQIKLTAEGLQFDNQLVDAVNIQRLVEPIQPVKKSIASLTEENPVLANVFKRSIEGLEDSEEKQAFMKASMEMNAGETFDKIKNIFKSAEPDSYPEIKTEDEFAMGGSVETPKRGLVDEPGSYAGERTSDALLKMRTDGMTIPEIARKYKVSVKTINNDLKKFNLLGMQTFMEPMTERRAEEIRRTLPDGVKLRREKSPRTSAG